MRVWSAWILLVVLCGGFALGQGAPAQRIAPGVWFLLGDSHKGYSNTVVIEMKDYLVVVDANYPGRAKELLIEVPKLSSKPVKYVVDTHAHGDHSYGNSVWTRSGATTLAYQAMLGEMDRYEPTRWLAAEAKRDDVRELHEATVESPKRTFGESGLLLKDATREVRLLFLGWGHTPADTYIWLPKERVLCTGDAAVNGPRNKLWDANLVNWPKALTSALALRPLVVLPGHGDAGGEEILSGQREFLMDLYSAVAEQVRQGRVPSAASVQLPERDRNWIPSDLSQDIEVTYSEIHQGKPAGALPHEWK
jgi:cyclase